METARGILEEGDARRFAEFHLGRRYSSTDGRGVRGHSAATAEGLVRSILSGGGGFVVDQKVLAIRGRAGHGLTWAAQELLEEARRAEPAWKRVVVLDARRGLAGALALAGWKPVHRALRSAGAAAGGAVLMRGLAMLLLLASLSAASGTVWTASGAAGPVGAGVPLLLGAGALGLAGAWWLARKQVADRMCVRLAECLAGPALDAGAAVAAGRAFGERLGRLQFFLVLIVDCYSRLPLAVRTAVVEALRVGQRDCVVTWFVLDADEPGLFRKDLAALQARSSEGLSVMTCELLPLTPDERVRLAGANGLSSADARDEDVLFEALRGRSGVTGGGSEPPAEGPKAAA